MCVVCWLHRANWLLHAACACTCVHIHTWTVLWTIQPAGSSSTTADAPPYSTHQSQLHATMQFQQVITHEVRIQIKCQSLYIWGEYYNWLVQTHIYSPYNLQCYRILCSYIVVCVTQKKLRYLHITHNLRRRCSQWPMHKHSSCMYIICSLHELRHTVHARIKEHGTTQGVGYTGNSGLHGSHACYTAVIYINVLCIYIYYM